MQNLHREITEGKFLQEEQHQKPHLRMALIAGIKKKLTERMAAPDYFPSMNFVGPQLMIMNQYKLNHKENNGYKQSLNQFLALKKPVYFS